MRTMLLCASLLAALLAAPVSAHLVPLNPSTCGLTIGLSAPTTGLTAAVDPPTTDLIRTVYAANGNPTESRVQVCAADPADPSGRCGAVVPRGFTMGGLAGTLALPAVFNLQLLSSGDLHGVVPITLVLDGSGAVVPFEVATSFVPLGSTLLLGSALDANGSFTLVGGSRGSTLAAPFPSSELQLSLACALAPAPDLDQFALAPRVTKVAGTSTRKQTKLTIVLETSAASPANFAGMPMYVRAGTLDAPLVAVDLSAGLGASGRKRFTGTLDPGTVTVTTLRRRTGLGYRVQVKGLAGLTTPAASGAGVLAVETGGLFARTPITLKANGAGTRLAVRMP